MKSHFKLFDDWKFTKAHQSCQNIRKMCRESIEKDKHQTKKIADRSIKQTFKN